MSRTKQCQQPNNPADLLSVCLEPSLPGGFTLLKWFPLRPPRTDFVSLGQTRHSTAEVLLSGTVRGGGGSSRGGAIIISPYKTSTFSAGLIPSWAPKRARLIATRPIWHKQKCAKRTLYVCSKTCTADSQKVPFGTNRNVQNGPSGYF